MASIRRQCAPFVRACLLASIGIGIVATAAQAQQKPATPGQFYAGKSITPLKLPPLPSKKVLTKKFGDWIQRCSMRPGQTEKKCF